MDIIGVEELKRRELRRIQRPELRFHTDHEALGVLYEEVDEAKVEMGNLKNRFEEYKNLVFRDLPDDAKLTELYSISNHAVLLAAEAVQVAAVAQKAINIKEARRDKSKKTKEATENA